MERFAIQRRRSIRNKSARTVSRLKDAERSQEPQSGPQTRPAYAEPFRQLAFGWQPVARPKVAPPNQLPHLPHHLLGCEARAGALQCFEMVQSRSGHTTEPFCCICTSALAPCQESASKSLTRGCRTAFSGHQLCGLRFRLNRLLTRHLAHDKSRTAYESGLTTCRIQ